MYQTLLVLNLDLTAFSFESFINATLKLVAILMFKKILDFT